MNYKISNGEYALDSKKNMIEIGYIELLLQNTALMLGAKRNKFYPDKNYGSLIFDAMDNKDKILAYARQAVSNLDGVCIKSASVNNNNIVFDLILNGEERSVVVNNG